MNAETTVLGCVLRDNNVYRVAAETVTGDDFENPTLGAVFDGIGRVIATGKKIDYATVETFFPEWEVRGVSPADPWLWADAGLYPELVQDAARSVRVAALRRRGRLVMGKAIEDLGDTGTDPATVLEQVTRDLIGTPRASLSSVTLGEVLQTPDSQDWVIPGLLERKDRLILTGHEGLGKTTLVRQMLLLPAAGVHPFTLERIDPVTALVIDAENTAKQWMRAARWMAGRLGNGVTDRVNMSLSGRLNILDPSTLGGIHRLIDQHKPGVVFIGPLYRLAINMNTDEQVAPVIAALDSIRDRGVALVIEAHAGHAIGAGGVRDVRPRGSSALLGWPEFGFGIRKDVSDGARPDVFDFVPWRGAREERDWPEQLRRGDRELGDWPWVAYKEWE
ncbi:AAA family ATPase [Microbacterium aerolatum]|uniref:AAA family ATPase n=1 Tax=Microbacterium aerolatum TaxID=153731 RepID=UPI00384D61E6